MKASFAVGCAERTSSISGMEEDAKLLETAVEKVLAGGLRTADIMSPGMARVGTSVFGEAVLRELDKLAA